MLLFLFWLSTCFILYTYIGYPLFIYGLARLAPLPKPLQPLTDEQLPDLSIIVPVYNEQANIAAKVATLKALDYPEHKRQIIFSSDGSTDETHTRVLAHEGVTLIDYAQRQGKPCAINAAAAKASGTVLLFTDGRQELASDAARTLVSRLYQQHSEQQTDKNINTGSIGAVSGELMFRDPKTQTGAQVGLYWRYEKFLRQQESRVASVAGVTGALYVIRRTDFTPLPTDTILDDFEIPIAVIKAGKRCLFEPLAKVYDIPQEDERIESRRKIRTLTGNYQSFSRHRWLFSPWRNPIFFQFISHKVLRLLVPYALVVCLLSNLLLLQTPITPGFYALAFWAQLTFYISGWLGKCYPGLKRHKIVAFASLFMELNWAVIQAAKQYIFNTVNVKWDKTS